MLVNKWVKYSLMIFSLCFFLTYVLELDAYARAGGGKSSGSRGSRSYSAPAPRTPAAPASPSRQVAPAPSAPMTAPQSGGFLRSMAGGLAGGMIGGMIGGMLFRGMGFAGGPGGGGGGIGLFDIILIGLILYGIWWFIKKKRQAAEATSGPAYYQQTSGSEPPQPAAYQPAYEPQPAGDDVDRGLGYIRQMDASFDEQRFKDQAVDHFFRVQAAWANRDITAIRSLLNDEMYGMLQNDAEELKKKKQINKIDNIAIRTTDVTEAWQEAGKDFITVRFYANLLDYTVDETTGQVIAGSKTEPVKFEEYWTFTRPVGNNPWQLSAINQA